MAKKSSKNKRRKRLKVLLLSGGVLMICAIGAYAYNAELYKKKFMPGLSFNGISAADRTLDEMQEILENKKQKYELSLRFMNDQTETITADEIGLNLNCQDELQKVMDSQNRFFWLAGVMGTKAPFKTETSVSFDEEKLRKVIESLPELQPENMLAPQDAGIVCNDDLTFSIVPEINGNTINTDLLVEAVKQAITDEEKTLNVVTMDDIYETPSVRSGDQVILDRRDSLNNLVGKNVVIHLSDGTDQVLDKTTLIEWIKTNDQGLYVVDPEYVLSKSEEYAASIAEKDDNYGYFREFASTNYGMVRLATEELHGHRLDQKATAESIQKALLSDGENQEVNLTYSVEVDKKDPRFGGTYVEVDVWSQHVYYYIGGDLYYDGNCVTGLEGVYSTPSGIFEIINMERGRTLEGYNSDGTLNYSAFVNFWMSFYPHYGLHDASWRGSFGGEIYTYDGSHGCVNLSYNTASAIYDQLEYGTPVIIFRGSDDVVIPEEDINPNTEDAANN